MLRGKGKKKEEGRVGKGRLGERARKGKRRAWLESRRNHKYSQRSSAKIHLGAPYEEFAGSKRRCRSLSSRREFVIEKKRPKRVLDQARRRSFR